MVEEGNTGEIYSEEEVGIEVMKCAEGGGQGNLREILVDKAIQRDKRDLWSRREIPVKKGIHNEGEVGIEVMRCIWVRTPPALP